VPETRVEVYQTTALKSKTLDAIQLSNYNYSRITWGNFFYFEMNDRAETEIEAYDAILCKHLLTLDDTWHDSKLQAE